MKSYLFHLHSIACNVVGTPSGEGFFRLSLFGPREIVLDTVERIKKNLKSEVGRQ
jgi:hypothetical protein